VKATARRAGFLTTVQDLGRTGFREFGVSLAGALDSFALRVANVLVGNNESSAGLEITLGGLQLSFCDERIIAWCGGGFDVRIGGATIFPGHPALVRAGDQLIFGSAKIGCRCWLAISGGIEVPVVLGSKSTDLRAHFGGLNGLPLHDGSEILLGPNSNQAEVLRSKLNEKRIAGWAPPHDWVITAKQDPVLRFVPGFQWNCFDDSAHAFVSEKFTVSTDSDRMGVRFEGPQLRRSDDRDLVSEAVAPGTVQVPPSGQPILLLGDCQTIGGYPKIANVITVDQPIAAQLRASDGVRFREISLSEAQHLMIDREEKFNQFRSGLESHFS
jgi:antagonist of KipI